MIGPAPLLAPKPKSGHQSGIRRHLATTDRSSLVSPVVVRSGSVTSIRLPLLDSRTLINSRDVPLSATAVAVTEKSPSRGPSLGSGRSVSTASPRKASARSLNLLDGHHP